MSVRSAQVITFDFTTRSPSTGAAVNADALPTGVLVKNGTDTAETVTVTNKATGIYKAAVTMPALAIGDTVEVRIAATVATVPDNAILWRDSCDLSIDASGLVSLPASQHSTIATAVRTNLATELARIDVATSTRLASASYTAPPSAAAIATQVRTELATELARIDVNVSSRMATFAYTVPPTVAAIATQVRTELATELARIDVATSTRFAAGDYQPFYSLSDIAVYVRDSMATELARIDVNVSSRLASGSYSAPPTAIAIAAQVRTNLTTELSRIDVATSTRLASASYTAPNNAGISNAALFASDAASYSGNLYSWIQTMIQLDGLVYRFTANALELAPVGGGGGGVAGSGADLVTLLISDTVSGNPVPDADVWLSSDAEGLTVVAGTKQTNISGEVQFLLDAGETYYIWMQKDGVNPILGQEFVAVAD